MDANPVIDMLGRRARGVRFVDAVMTSSAAGGGWTSAAFE